MDAATHPSAHAPDATRLGFRARQSSVRLPVLAAGC